jgi:hypothetical protein
MLASSAKGAVRIGAFETREDRTYDLTVENDVLLGDSEDADVPRVAMLVRRVVTWADSLGEEHLPGRDEGLATFRGELGQEGNHGR